MRDLNMQKSTRKYKGNTKIHKIFNVHISNRIFIPLIFFCNCVHKNLNLRKHPQFDHCRNIFTKIKNRMIYKKKKKKLQSLLRRINTRGYDVDSFHVNYP